MISIVAVSSYEIDFSLQSYNRCLFRSFLSRKLTTTHIRQVSRIYLMPRQVQLFCRTGSSYKIKSFIRPLYYVNVSHSPSLILLKCCGHPPSHHHHRSMVAFLSSFEMKVSHCYPVTNSFLRCFSPSIWGVNKVVSCIFFLSLNMCLLQPL